MRVIIAGGRNFDDFDFLFYVLVSEFTELTQKGILSGDVMTDVQNIEIVSGKADGADKLGEKFAEFFDIKVKPFPADWDNLDVDPCVVKHNNNGKPYNALAGYIRNKQMLDYALEEENGLLVAFWDGKSKGTKSMIELAEKAGLRVKIATY